MFQGISLKRRGREKEKERERVNTGEAKLVQKPHNFILKFYIMEDTESCRGSSPDPFRISFCIQKVSGDLHYLLAQRLANTLWHSFLMNVNFISPEVFFFNLHHPQSTK